MSYDVIVLGTGGIGSAALYHLAKRGARVLGLDRFPPGHNRGSSHGASRIIRLSYYEGGHYVPLLRRAYTLWDELDEKHGGDLFHRTGLLYLGPPAASVLESVRKSARQHNLALEDLTPDDVRVRYPGFVVPDGADIVLEPNAGYLRVEACVQAHITEAMALGAIHRHGETLLRWRSEGSSVVVDTDQGRYRANQLLLAMGAWAKPLLKELNVPLTLQRKHLHWYATDDPSYLEASGCPCFFYELDGDYFYGFPNTGDSGLKVAEHSPGTVLPDDADPLLDPRQPETLDTERIEGFVRGYLPGVSLRRLRHAACFYTMSPDGQFVVDRHPEHEAVLLAAGFSGHGFKFASALGQLLAELALDGTPSLPIDFLGLDRFAPLSSAHL